MKFFVIKRHSWEIRLVNYSETAVHYYYTLNLEGGVVTSKLVCSSMD